MFRFLGFRGFIAVGVMGFRVRGCSSLGVLTRFRVYRRSRTPPKLGVPLKRLQLTFGDVQGFGGFGLRVSIHLGSHLGPYTETSILGAPC